MLSAGLIKTRRDLRSRFFLVLLILKFFLRFWLFLAKLFFFIFLVLNSFISLRALEARCDGAVEG
jgi:hypothetical protein